MKALLTGFVSATLLSVLAFAHGVPSTSGTAAQQQQSPATNPAAESNPQAAQPIRIAPGSVIPVQLTKTIDAKKAKNGEEIEAKVTQDMKAANGEIIVPKDTRVTGHITEARARNKEHKESDLGIDFDHAGLKDGRAMALPMSIQAVISPSYLSGGNNNAANSSGAEDTTPASSGGGGMPSGSSGGRVPGMSGGNQPQMPSTGGGEAPANSGSSTPKNRPQITGTTQGVLGIPNVKLSATENSDHASVLSSEKSNVKLETGTLMLLRVNP